MRYSPPRGSQSRGRMSALRAVPQERAHVGTSRSLHGRTVVDDRYETGRGPFAGLEQVDVDVYFEWLEKRRRLEHERWIQQVQLHTFAPKRHGSNPDHGSSSTLPQRVDPRRRYGSLQEATSRILSAQEIRATGQDAQGGFRRRVGQIKSQRPLQFELTRLLLLRNGPWLNRTMDCRPTARTASRPKPRSLTSNDGIASSSYSGTRTPTSTRNIRLARRPSSFGPNSGGGRTTRTVQKGKARLPRITRSVFLSPSASGFLRIVTLS